MSSLNQLEAEALRLEIKRIGRKARRFIARNKGQTKAAFPVDQRDYPGSCLNIDNQTEKVCELL